MFCSVKILTDLRERERGERPGEESTQVEAAREELPANRGASRETSQRFHSTSTETRLLQDAPYGGGAVNCLGAAIAA